VLIQYAAKQNDGPTADKENHYKTQEWNFHSYAKYIQ